MCLITIPYVSYVEMLLSYNYRGISEPGHGKEVVDVLKDIDKSYIYQLMSKVQLPGSKTFDSQIIMHYCTEKNDISLTKEFQKHLFKEHYKNGVIDQGNKGKISSKRKLTDRYYHV